MIVLFLILHTFNCLRFEFITESNDDPSTVVAGCANSTHVYDPGQVADGYIRIIFKVDHDVNVVSSYETYIPHGSIGSEGFCQDSTYSLQVCHVGAVGNDWTNDIISYIYIDIDTEYFLPLSTSACGDYFEKQDTDLDTPDYYGYLQKYNYNYGIKLKNSSDHTVVAENFRFLLKVPTSQTVITDVQVYRQEVPQVMDERFRWFYYNNTVTGLSPIPDQAAFLAMDEYPLFYFELGSTYEMAVEFIHTFLRWTTQTPVVKLIGIDVNDFTLTVSNYNEEAGPPHKASFHLEIPSENDLDSHADNSYQNWGFFDSMSFTGYIANPGSTRRSIEESFITSYVNRKFPLKLYAYGKGPTVEFEPRIKNINQPTSFKTLFYLIAVFSTMIICILAVLTLPMIILFFLKTRKKGIPYSRLPLTEQD